MLPNKGLAVFGAGPVVVLPVLDVDVELLASEGCGAGEVGDGDVVSVGLCGGNNFSILRSIGELYLDPMYKVGEANSPVQLNVECLSYKVTYVFVNHVPRHCHSLRQQSTDPPLLLDSSFV